MATADVQNPTAALTEEAPAVETPVAAEEAAKTEEVPAPAEAEVEAPAPVEVEATKEEAPGAAETEEAKETEPAAAADRPPRWPASACEARTETEEGLAGSASTAAAVCSYVARPVSQWSGVLLFTRCGVGVLCAGSRDAG
uniref:Uncharacterized protein n=1 Tax=Aegilops tauschii subsp. strangulata TaxID=200361 RepID=A0A453L3G3_AEGTS